MRFLPGVILGALVNVVFWVLYTSTGSLAVSIPVAVVIATFGIVAVRRRNLK